MWHWLRKNDVKLKYILKNVWNLKLVNVKIIFLVYKTLQMEPNNFKVTKINRNYFKIIEVTRTYFKVTKVY